MVDKKDGTSVAKQEEGPVPRTSALYRFWEVFKQMPSILLLLLTALSKSAFRGQLEGREKNKRPLREHVLLGLEALGELWAGKVGNPSSRKEYWVEWLMGKIRDRSDHPEFWKHYYSGALGRGLKAFKPSKPGTSNERGISVVPEVGKCWSLSLKIGEECTSTLFLNVWVYKEGLTLSMFQMCSRLDEPTTHFILQHMSECFFSMGKPQVEDHYFIGERFSISFDAPRPENMLDVTPPEKGKWSFVPQNPEEFLRVVQGILAQNKIPGELTVVREPDFRNKA